MNIRNIMKIITRLITSTSRRDHITPVPRHVQVQRQVQRQVPVRHGIEFKLAVLVFKALHGLAR